MNLNHTDNRMENTMDDNNRIELEQHITAYCLSIRRGEMVQPQIPHLPPPLPPLAHAQTGR